MTLQKVALRRVIECLDSQRVPLNRGERAEIPGMVPYWGAGGVLDHVDRHIFDETLVLLGEDGAPFFTSDKDVSYLIKGPSWVNNHIHVLRPRGINPSFLRHALNAVDYGKYITGSTRDKLTQEDMLSIEVSLPPLDEQHRIGYFLDIETARIDGLVRFRWHQIELLKERSGTAISELVTPGISNNDQQLSAKCPWLPAWISTCRLGHLAQVQSGVTVHEGRRPTPGDREYPYLRVANVQGDGIDLAVVKTIRIPTSMASRATLRHGDVLMTEANGNPDNLGRGAVWHGEIANAVHQNHIFAIRSDQRRLLPEYLAALLSSVHGRRYFRFTSTQVGIATTSSFKVLDFPVPVASIEDQRLAVVRYAETREEIDRAVDTLKRQLTLLAERRQALVTAAVNGQIDVATARGVAA